MEVLLSKTPDYVFEIQSIIDPLAERIMHFGYNSQNIAEKAFGKTETLYNVENAVYLLGVNLFNRKFAAKHDDIFLDRNNVRAALFSLASENLIGKDQNYFAKSMLLNYAAFGRDPELVFATTFLLHKLTPSPTMSSHLSLLQAVSTNNFISRFGHLMMAITDNPRYGDYCDLICKQKNDVREYIRLVEENADLISVSKYYSQIDKADLKVVPELDLFHICAAEVALEDLGQSTLSRLSNYVADDSPFFRDLMQGFVISFNIDLMSKTLETLQKDRQMRVAARCDQFINYLHVAEFLKDWEKINQLLSPFMSNVYGKRGAYYYEKIITPIVKQLSELPDLGPDDKPIKPGKDDHTKPKPVFKRPSNLKAMARGA